jgi:hypothetical protein
MATVARCDGLMQVSMALISQRVATILYSPHAE